MRSDFPRVGVRARLGLLLAFLAVPATLAANQARPEISIPRVPRPPVLEEFLDMRGPDDLTSVMAHVDSFTQRKPVDGAPASQRTDVYLGYDDKHLYVVFIAFDDEPDKVRAHMARRENVFGDDIVEIQLDTFLDQQRAFSFIVNPLGVQFDAIWTEGSGRGGPGSNFDSSWDAVWQSRGELTDQGYVVWLSIPFRSLRFPPTDLQRWGIILVRDVQRLDEDTFWPPVTQRIEGRMNQAGIANGMAGITGGGNTQIIPYATARSFETIDTSGDPVPVSDDFDPDAGVDAKIVFDDRLALDLTANPDFSQIESDQPQVTVNQRFEVFFPERRPFFLENANYFNTPFNLLFTRRIADPRVGARLSGKVGKYALAALIIDDESPGKSVPDTDPLFGEEAVFGVLRAIRDIGEQSKIGFFFTDRELDDRSNRVYAVDGRIKLNDNWVTEFQAASSMTDPGGGGPDVTDQAYQIFIDRSGRHYNGHHHYFEVGPGFETDAGFVSRTDIRNAHTRQGWTFRPEGDLLISWEPSIYLARIEDFDGVRLERTTRAEIQFDLKRSTEIELTLSDGKEFLRPEDLLGLVEPSNPMNPPVFTQGIDYDTSNVSIKFGSRPVSAIDFDLEFGIGEAINFVPGVDQVPFPADRTSSRAGATFRPTTPTRLTLTYLGTTLDDDATGERVLKNEIARVRFDWQLTRKWSLRAILDAEKTDVNPALTRLEQDRRLNGDLLSTYLVNPWTALYVGYSQTRLNRDLILDPMGNRIVNTGTDLNKVADQFFVKFSYLFQL